MPAPRRLRVDESFWERINTQEKAYFLGLMYADGYNNVKGNFFKLSLVSSDRDIVDRFKIALNSDAPIAIRRGSRYNTVCETASLQICSKKMCQDLMALGCGQNKSDVIRFPRFLDKNLWPHFVRGYFDGDGGFSKEANNRRAPRNVKYRVNIVSNPAFISDLNDVFEECLGKRFVIQRYHKHIKTEQIRIEGNRQAEWFLAWLYQDATVFLKRKHDLFLEMLDRPYYDKRVVYAYRRDDPLFVLRFDSRKEAADHLQIHSTSVVKCCQNPQWSCKGFYFRDEPITLSNAA